MALLELTWPVGIGTLVLVVLNFAYLAANGTLLVGDPAANRLVRLNLARIFHDSFD